MQQSPVRYYIVKGDDQAVVRSIPVRMPAKRHPAERIAQATAPRSSHLEKRREAGPAKTRVGRLVRAAARRSPTAR